jgi:hypothetical protein
MRPGSKTGPIRVVELRDYLLQGGATGDFARYFEEHFLVSQRDEGMHVLGQFAVVDEPDRFVWFRGFEDMETRLHGLTAFYGGPVWQAHRTAANGMMRESHHVHLLRPLGPVHALTGGLALEDRASEPPGVFPPHTGLVVADFYRSRAGGLGRVVEWFEQHLQPGLVAHGTQVLGHFVAELTPNDYPRLPVIQDPELLVVLTAYRDGEHHAAARADWQRSAAWRAGPGGAGPAALAGGVATLRLRPTARSLIRHRGEGAGLPSPRR